MTSDSRRLIDIADEQTIKTTVYKCKASDFSVLSGVIILIINLSLMHMRFILSSLSVHFHISHICAICLTFCSLCRCSWLSPTWSSGQRNKARVEQNEKGREKRTQSTSIPTGTERGERKGRNVVRASLVHVWKEGQIEHLRFFATRHFLS